MKRSGLEPQSLHGGSAEGHLRSSSPVPTGAGTTDGMEAGLLPDARFPSRGAGMTPSSAPSRPGYTKQGIVSSESLKEAEQSWADQQVTTSSCAFCDWTHEGTAGEGRSAARAHREEQHPEACIKKPRMRRRIVKKSLRSADEEAQIAVDTAEARRLRSEREQAEMLAKIERGRERDRAALAALDGAA